MDNIFSMILLWINLFTLQVPRCTGNGNYDALRFLAIADWGGTDTHPYTTAVQHTVARQMAKMCSRRKTSFVLSLGDNFYRKGVQNVQDRRFKLTFEDVYFHKLLFIPWYIVAGNHDYAGNVQAQLDYSKSSVRWNFPDYYYKITKSIPGGKTIDIILLDTAILCGVISGAHQPGPRSNTDAERQWAWIEEQLKTSTADYLLVMGHYPVRSTGWNGPTHILLQRLEPLLYRYNVNAYIAGHEHNMQHIQMKHRRKYMNYFIIGAGSKMSSSVSNLYTIPKKSLKYRFADNVTGAFSYFEVSNNVMKIKFIDGFGIVQYEYEMKPRF